MSESVWVWFIAILMVQEVEQLEDQKSKAKNTEGKKYIDLEQKLKNLESKLASSKLVSWGNSECW